MPLPSHVYCPLEVQARDAESVYCRVDGILDKVLVRPGDQVNEGQLLAQLHNIDVDITIAELTGQRDVYRAQLEGLNRVSFDDRRASAQIDPITEALASTKEQLAKREDDREKLRLVAPRAGTVLPPPLVEKQGDERSTCRLGPARRSIRENIGATLTIGTKLCQIGDPQSLEARLVIDQGDVEFVAPGQNVEIMLDQSAEYVYVEQDRARLDAKTVKTSPTHLSSLHGGSLPTQMDPGGSRPAAEPDLRSPRAAARGRSEHGLLRIGLVGRAKITTAPRTLWSRLYRYAARTFNFEL